MFSLKSASRIISAGFLACSLLSQSPTQAQEAHPVRSVVDISHEFTFYATGVANFYFPDGRNVTNSGNLYDIDVTNVNLLLLMGCNQHLEYTKKDIEFLDKFIEDGACVVLFGNIHDKSQNALARRYGAHFVEGSKMPYAPTAKLKLGEMTIEGQNWPSLTMKNAKKWEVLVRDADKKPLRAPCEISLYATLEAHY